MPVAELTTAGVPGSAAAAGRELLHPVPPAGVELLDLDPHAGPVEAILAIVEVSTTGPTPVIRCSPLASATLNLTTWPIGFGDFVAMNSDLPSQ